MAMAEGLSWDIGAIYPNLCIINLEPDHQRQNIFELGLLHETFWLSPWQKLAETIVRQCWRAEKSLLKGCLQYVAMHMLRLCGKSDAKKLFRSCFDQATYQRHGPFQTEGVSRTFCTRPLSHTVWSDLGPGSNPNSWQFLGAESTSLVNPRIGRCTRCLPLSV